MRVLKYLSFLLMIVALIGFYQSSLLHLSIVRSPNESASENWWLSLGLFVIWFPAMFASHKLRENSNEQDSWQAMLGFRLSWMKFIVLGLFAYGFINYLVCLCMYFVVTPGNWSYWQIRGNSGLIMLGYVTVARILYRFWRS